jgi:hypothetical protein
MYNRNPGGSNQDGDVGKSFVNLLVPPLIIIATAKVDNPVLIEALQNYHRQYYTLTTKKLRHFYLQITVLS